MTCVLLILANAFKFPRVLIVVVLIVDPIFPTRDDPTRECEDNLVLNLLDPDFRRGMD